MSVKNLKSTKPGERLSPYAPRRHLYANSSPSLPTPTNLLLNGDGHPHTTYAHQYHPIGIRKIVNPLLQLYPISLGLCRHPLSILLLQLLLRLRYLIMHNPIFIQFLHNLKGSRNCARKKCIVPLVGSLAAISLAVANVVPCGAQDPAGW